LELIMNEYEEEILDFDCSDEKEEIVDDAVEM
jgi:hypothetical protein